MTKIIKRKICDVCKKEIKDFAGLLKFNYSVSGHFPTNIEAK